MMYLSFIALILCSIFATSDGAGSVLDEFTSDGVGICYLGRYAGYSVGSATDCGWSNCDDDTSMTLENCASLCDSEEHCSYFSVDPGNYCSRYTNTPGITEQLVGGKSVVGVCTGRFNNAWFDKHSVYAKKSAYTNEILDKFIDMGKGKCPTGYYKGWDDDEDLEYMTLERCALICDSEPECTYFSVWETRTCMRYTNVKWLASSFKIAGDCISDDPTNAVLKLFGKKQESITVISNVAHSVLDEFTSDGVGICYLGRYAGYSVGTSTDCGWPDCYDYLSMTLETCASLCDSEEHCSYFSVDPGNYCSRYTNTPGITEQLVGSKSVVGFCTGRFSNAWFDQHSVYAKKTAYTDDILDRFIDKGKGKCPTGYYAGWADDDYLEYMTLERCLHICESEPHCKFISVWETRTCMRYTDIKTLASQHNIAGDCISDDPTNAVLKLFEKKNAVAPCYGPTARICGDPHIQTFDGLEYDCHGAGEFVAVKSGETDFAIHARFEHYKEENTGITVARGFALNGGVVGDPIVSIITNEDEGLEKCVMTMKINGEKTSPIQSVADGPHIYHNENSRGGSITYVTMSSGATIAVHTSRSEVIGCFMSIDVCVSDDMAENDSIVGLLGTPNGNDWMNPAGEKVDVPQDESDLRFGKAYEYCVDNWGVTDIDKSLFDYTASDDADFNYYNRFPDETFNDEIAVLFQDADDEIKAKCNDNIECIIETLGASEEDAVLLEEIGEILDQIETNPLDVIDVPHADPPAPIVERVLPTASVSGDPHFTTWSGEKYDFQGICDLVLLKNSKFNGGLGMDIHVRAKRKQQWSFISTAVVRIGNESFEVSGHRDGDTYWVNGIEKGSWEEERDISGYPISYRMVHSVQREYVIDLGKNEKIIVKTWNDFVRVDLVGPRFEDFGASQGLLGSFPEGARLGRDSQAIVEDWNKFGQEWQVLASDPKLFNALEGPQCPEQCTVATKLALRRRLEESYTTREQAERACSRVSEEERTSCIFDVMVTDDETIADAYL